MQVSGFTNLVTQEIYILYYLDCKHKMHPTYIDIYWPSCLHFFFNQLFITCSLRFICSIYLFRYFLFLCVPKFSFSFKIIIPCKFTYFFRIYGIGFHTFSLMLRAWLTNCACIKEILTNNLKQTVNTLLNLLILI